MKFATVCSGIEACSSAWEPLGWKAQFFSEIDPFPCEVLKYHYPTVPNYGDMTQYKEWKDGSVDVICGGTPCQSFSVAGLRKGIESPNGQLMLTFGAILKKYQPRWMVWENVPGVLSSNRGKDFGTFLGMLGELGYGFAYRVLNAEYFGVAQRRRRVFVVGYLGDWKRPASVLFEPESLQGDLAKSRKKGQGTAGHTENGTQDGSIPQVSPTLTSNAAGMSRTGNGCNEGSWYIPTQDLPSCTPTLNGEELKRHVSNQMIGNAESWFFPEVKEKMGTITSRMFNALGARDVEEGALVPELYSIHRNAFNMSDSMMEKSKTSSSQDNLIKTDNKSPPIISREPPHGVAYSSETIAIQGDGGTSMSANGMGWKKEQSFTLNSTDKHSVAFSLDSVSSNSMKSDNPTSGSRQVNKAKTIDTTSQDPSKSQGGIAIANSMQVRRLTPTECERLQGFKDGHTKIPYRNKPADECPDGPRYKALGNSMAVPVMKWIGERIMRTEKIFNELD